MIKHVKAAVNNKCKNTQSLNYLTEKFMHEESMESEDNLFENVADVFEIALNKLNTTDCDKKVYDRLLQIQDLIQKKILIFQSIKDDSVKYESSESISEYPDLELSKLSSLFDECITSKTSLSDLYKNSSFKEFLKRVNCPFCLKPQYNKISLVEHLDACEKINSREFNQNVSLFCLFQILPNNTFKCNICLNSVQSNLIKYYKHMQDPSHILVFKNLTKKNNVSDFLYCSCCKVQIPSNYTQINFHISHENHKKMRKLNPSMKNLINPRVSCAYLKNKKFKCLKCPSSQSLFKSNEALLKHFHIIRHKEINIQERLENQFLFCEFCLVEVKFLEIQCHISSNSHTENEKALEKTFELCYYCGFSCDNLNTLSSHMQKNCEEVNKLKINILKTNNLEKNLLAGNESGKNKNTENIESEWQIIVKDCTAIKELCRIFEKFGEITYTKIHNGKNVIIAFKNKNSFEKVLPFRDDIKINGKKVEILISKTVENLREATEETEVFDFDQSLEICNSKVFDGDSDISEDKSSDFNYYSNLFQRVSCFLEKVAVKLDSFNKDFITKIYNICFSTQECDFVGFTKLELTFKSEKISLFCDVSNLYNCFSNEKLLVEFLRLKLTDSGLWDEVKWCTEQPFHYYKCVEIKSKITYTITIMPGAKFLTDMLSHCLEKNKMARTFCLVTRLWLSVHKLKIRECEYLLISFFVFFLINKNVAKPFTAIDKLPKETLAFHLAITVKIQSEHPHLTKDDECTTFSSAEEMFHKFLEFLHDFDFVNFAICLPIKYPVPKDFLLEDKFISFLKTNNVKLKQYYTWVLDPFLKVNLGLNVPENDIISLLDIAGNTVEILPKFE